MAVTFYPILFMTTSLLAPTSAFERSSVGITRIGQKLRGIFADIAPK